MRKLREVSTSGTDRPTSSISHVIKTVSLTETDLRDAARLLRLLSDPALLENKFPELFPAVEPEVRLTNRLLLRSRARAMLSGRLARPRYFHPDLLGEPAWDILLALYIIEEAGARFTIGKLAECIDAPLSTVARWIRTLEEQTLVSRVEHPTDGRIVFVRLLEKGRKGLDDYLSAIPSENVQSSA